MTSIMGYSESLLNVRLSERQKKQALQNIHSAGVRMEQMSAKLLALVGMYENEAIRREELSLRDLLEQVREETRALPAARNVTLLVEFQEDMRILGDRELLCSLFVNLVHNVCKASDPGGKVLVSARGRTVTVEDKGCGIPEKDLPHVTEAFYMADKSRSRSEGGSGLGLALGQRIVQLHGGTMEIESKAGEGTRVSVTFP